MRGYLYLSSAAHGALLVLLVALGTLLSKPRMSYYAVDLISSLPSGGGTGVRQTVATVSKTVEARPAAEKPKPISKEAIRVASKEKKKVQPVPSKLKSSAAFDAAMRAARDEGPE